MRTVVRCNPHRFQPAPLFVCSGVAAGPASPYAPAISWGLGLRMTVALEGARSLESVVAELRRAASANPRRPQIWRQFADHLDLAGDRAAAATAYLTHVRESIHDPALMA